MRYNSTKFRNKLYGSLSFILAVMLIFAHAGAWAANYKVTPRAQLNRTTVVKGIVEENNPQMGYITLYGEDGTGTEPGIEQFYILRTYNYGDMSDLEVLKNNKEASIEDIETGDTVFLKLDENMYVISVSAVDNYTAKYGVIISKRSTSLVVEYDDGEQQVLEIDDDTFVSRDKKPAAYSSLKDGDRVRLLLHITNKFTKVKEIAVESGRHFITAIYKGKVDYVDEMSDKIVMMNLEVFDGGRWSRTNKIGFSSFKLADGCSFYYDNKAIDVSTANKYLRENEAYIAVVKDYDGKEKVAFVSYRDEEDTEDIPYDDTVSYVLSGSGIFRLSKSTERIRVGKGAIVVKDGRLVSGASIAKDDMAYVVANRDFDSGEYYAGIVQISDRSDVNFVQIYRGRISKIDENRSFTLESFSQLNGLNWEYTGAPKTFKLNFDSRIVDDKGVVNQRNFRDYGDDSYAGKTVYVIANGTNTLLISTAPYGVYNVRGEIYEISGGLTGDEGTVLSEPDVLKVTDAKVYDLTSRIWKDSKEMTLNILQNSIILKDKKIVKPSDLEVGDRIRAIKRDGTVTGDAYIIIVEN
ncbi:hypothetical protein CDQ84_13565 [Clostridium thermosuccinogenes]|uniref:DUF5666 domain-containing protein n=2 Tax=Clostridium thermosuccinogenes TaxID=84032 RepID=A0A2K2FEN0_9CLOT|nr:hypothetical protein [Pseudoclostridium thermosuccinogenes]AUS97772.1 hypothetical protein CDO33_15785 [Pseudoclostridium thermosuccinogenes]PNT95892.1 hypothetical protein CDQ85_13630 [Pseudoclostridium thermosuccinogenes]PNT97206.1 hypothetical protein CDQ84_13565 [Pseudoclostridium thermosuccinogenes]